MVTRLGRVALLGVFASLCFLVFGCAVGRSEEGGIVLGVEAGRLVETGEQAGAVAVETVAQAIGLGGLGLGGIGAVLVRNWKRASERAAIAEGRHAGWDERELAAARQPIPAPQSAGGASPDSGWVEATAPIPEGGA